MKTGSQTKKCRIWSLSDDLLQAYFTDEETTRCFLGIYSFIDIGEYERNEKSPPPLSLEEKLWTRGASRKHQPPGQERGRGKLRRDRRPADLTDRRIKKM